MKPLSLFIVSSDDTFHDEMYELERFLFLFFFGNIFCPHRFPHACIMQGCALDQVI